MQRSFGPSRSPTYYRYTSSYEKRSNEKVYTLTGLLFEEPSRRNCVCLSVCMCVLCVYAADNVERKEGGRKGECRKRKRKRGGSTFLACNYVGILTVEESFLDRLAMH